MHPMMNRPFRSLLLLAALVAVTPVNPAAAAPALALRQGDHVALVGGALADRMQHSGWLEAMVYQRHPKLDLVFRNLGFAGDEVQARLRSENFGSPDDWLKRVKADVVWGFFGFNESFKGEAGLDKFKQDLEKWITDTRKQDYSGRGAPRLVLFSPIAAEKHRDPNMPDPGPTNERLKPYVAAMAEVAKAQGVPFVDLFAASQKAYGQARQSLTINGVHLSDEGYRALAPAMFQALFDEAAPAAADAAVEKLRAAINDKNAVWFSRYRTVDGYNVYGGRSALAYQADKGGFVSDRNAPAPHISNYKVMQREMSQRDVMTANRDARIWAVAQGGDRVVKDDNLPEAIEVASNKPGKNPDKSHVFLGGEEAIARMKVPAGCKVNLFADEKQFPDLVNPVQMAFDTKGRLWVAVWPNYPERRPTSTKGDSLLIFEDTDNDGKADKSWPFLEDLNCPTGFQFYKDGVIVVQAPDVWFVRDTDGDGRADWKERVLNGLDSADSHHTANALCLDPGGAIYLSDGVFHRTQVETALGPVRNHDGAIYRFEPRASKFERYIPYGFANPHGRVFDRWGNDFVTDATGNNTYFGPGFSGYIDASLPSAKHSGYRQFWERPSRPCPGTGILSSRHFPEEFQGNFLNVNVIGFQGIYRVKVREEGAGLWGDTIPAHLVSSDDPNFRPTAVDVAPDGSVYFIDWHNAIIGHMQHHLRDPNRDNQHGRVYRMTYEGRPLTKPAPIAGQPIEALLDLLKAPEDNVRTRAKIELGARDTKQVIAAVQKWARQFSPRKVEDQHALTEALWVHQWHNVVNEPFLRQMLQSPDPRARAAAARVLCYWRDRVPDSLSLFRTLAADPAPRVRLEAVRAASFYRGPEALEVAYEAQQFEMDYYLDYCFKQTLKQLQRTTQQLVLPKQPKALAKVLAGLSNKELLAAPAMEGVLNERVDRKGLTVNDRAAALEELAKLRKSDRITETLVALRRLDTAEGSPSTIADLATLLTVSGSDLRKSRPALATLSREARNPAVRRASFAALIAADGKPDTVWAATAGDAGSRAALIDALVHLGDPDARAAFQPLLAGAIADAKSATAVHDAALRALPLMGNANAPANFTILATHLREGRSLTTASRALMQLPRDSWRKEQAAPVAESILAWAGKVPTRNRTSQDFVETVQAGLEVASLLPAAEATRLRTALLDLGVRVFVVKTIREGMRYDTTRLVVEAGKPFEVIFENIDFMPHNLVFTQPGAKDEVSTQALTMSPTPDKDGKAYVPNNRKIIAASKMLDAGQKETLKLNAPAKPGNYDFVCTYPEHGKSMFGTLVVVKDKEAFLKAAAEPAPAPPAGPLEPVCGPNAARQVAAVTVPARN
jgi:lysophospholipase L1-like esterase/glucose/arabinose dehydrogenase/azurin